MQKDGKSRCEVMAANCGEAMGASSSQSGSGTKRVFLSMEAKREIVARCADGILQKDVAAMYRVSPSCVSKMVRSAEKAARARGMGDTITQRGRPPKLGDKDAKALKKMAEKSPFCTAQSYLAELLGKNRKRISRWTAQRYLKKMDVRYRIAARKPLLTKRHRKLRLAWARQHQTWTEEDWMKILFSDETSIEIMENSRRRACYRTPQQKHHPRFISATVKHPARIMVWGCLGNERVGPLHLVTGTIDNHAYIRILRKCLPAARHDVFNDEDFVFQQDNAPCHVSGTTKRWFARHEIETMEWPPQSPDMNPIENLWAILKRRVHAQGPFQNTEALCEAVKNCWGAIPEETLLSLVRSMPDRVKEVIKNRGGQTGF